jgi:hypothetical protein
VAGFVLAAALFRALLGRRPPLGAAVPAVVALTFAVLVVPAVWGGMRTAGGVRGGLVLAPGINEREKCLVDGGSSDAVGISHFVIQRVPPQARLAVYGTVPRVCLQLTLLPRRFVGAAEPHDYSLYTGDIPPDVRARPGAEVYEDSAVLVREG